MPPMRQENMKCQDKDEQLYRNYSLHNSNHIYVTRIHKEQSKFQQKKCNRKLLNIFFDSAMSRAQHQQTIIFSIFVERMCFIAFGREKDGHIKKHKICSRN
ncbi:hypothetical protein Tsp_01407 [Trichinella spiralis]|uniref:hypothetical protein n=1 Tax=Trichinella spiralis TaxID=6334 RepID=UPI0001EFB4CC|nr:hypothetical protein Tsp_01407 [Trichinella spiralis]